MRRVIVIAAAGLSLAGCSSFSLDCFQADAASPSRSSSNSTPPGADARTSLGPGCKTPCSVSVPAPDSGFSVTYTLPRFQPVTVPVQVIRIPGDLTSPASTTIDPNPVFAELQPAGPPPKPARKMVKPRKPKATQDRSAAACGIAFPDPAQAPPAAAHAADRLHCTRQRSCGLYARSHRCLDCGCTELPPCR